ncbi:right-handed parallel beta-helix repeat-containing protein [Methanimicrococcus hongohii]|uniref:right-handed parallel beta-helix repeat-containing protein n=1 Tax=Methanimicrococcus hongohii TaxID=3028295 RepID=UPI00292F2E37|nr:right-handed parallel beta-helix repeat-containing protein [Methanimicrococcus sp. Hf6]
MTFFAILFLFLGTASATEFYATDETTLKDAFSSAINGDIIVVQNDITLAATNIPFSNSGTIIVRSVDDTKKTIYGNGTTAVNFNNHFQHFVLNEVNNNDTHLIFENIVLDGNGGTGGFKIMGKTQSPYNNANNITVEGVQIKNSTTSGIFLTDADTASLDNIIVEECKSNGVYILRCSGVVISDSIIQNNVASTRGGGLNITSDDVGAVSVEVRGHTLIKNNTAPQGAGISLSGSLNANPAKTAELVLSEDVVITENMATGSQGVGGGINATSNSTLTISGNVEISQNEAGYGGGISASETVLKVSGNSKIIDNKAFVGSTSLLAAAAGGGIYAQTYSEVKIFGNAVVNNNTADSDTITSISGGAIRAGSSNVLIDIYDDAEIADNIARYGGAVYTGGNLNISGNASVHSNKATTGGAIYSGGNLSIFGNSSVHSNAADYGGGIYATSANKDFKLYDSASVSNNTADYSGGGIYMSNTRGNLDLKNNVTFSKNSALDAHSVADGFGGALCVLNPSSLITISGSNADDCVEFSLNKAINDGGAIWVTDVSQISNTGGQKLLFILNSAETGYKWDTGSGSLTPTLLTAASVYLSQMPNVTSTVPFTNAYNNYDIAFLEGEESAVSRNITIDYYVDSVDAVNLTGTESFGFYSGEQITLTVLETAFGANWMNLYKPVDYSDGKLQQILPFTLNADTILDVLYTKGNNGNNSSGGNGTGNATIKDLVNTSDSSDSNESGGMGGTEDSGFEEDTPEEPVQEKKCSWLWIILLLILIAIVCYLYRRYKERKDE